VYKDGKVIETVQLGKKLCYLFGRQEDLVDVPLLHPSISREHAVVVHGSPPSLVTETEGDEEPPPPRGGATLIDLNSSWGTFISKSIDKAGKKLDPKQNWVLHEGDCLRFGDSTRRYVVRGLGETKAAAPSTAANTQKGTGGSGGSGGRRGGRRVELQTKKVEREAPAKVDRNHAYGGYFTKSTERLEGMDNVKVGQDSKKEKNVKKPSTVWQEQAGELGDANRSEKFLKLLGAKKGTSDTGYLQKNKKKE